MPLLRLRLLRVRGASLVMTALLPLTLLPAACGSPFSNCEDTLSCADSGTGGSDAGGAGGEGGAPSRCQVACSGSRPICDEAAGECVGCLSTEDCQSGVCDPETKSCVGCLEHADCAAENKPLCVEQRCIACDDEGDDTTSCAEQLDLAVCLPSGACVECETATADSDCDGNVCDPDTNTCTGTGIGSVSVCGECEHDADCDTGMACVEMSFADPSPAEVVGKFCLWKKGTPVVDGGPGGVCTGFRGFQATLSATSVEASGAEDFCAPRTTTCVGYQHYPNTRTGCETSSDDAACGVEGRNDALCRLNGDSQPLCTYPCLGGNNDCPVGATCTSGYCSL